MNTTEDNSSETVDLRQLLALLRKHIWALIISSIGFAFIGWFVSDIVMIPKYSSSAQVLVNDRSNKADPNAAYAAQQANMQMVTTYKDIITSHVILQEASKRLANPSVLVKKAQPAKYRKDASGKRILVKKAQPAVYGQADRPYSVSASELASSISVNTQQQSQVFSVTATADTPYKSRAEANAVAEVFKAQVPNIMSVNNVTIVAPATTGTQSSPNVKLFTLAGFVVGLVLCVMIIILKNMINTTVRDDSYLSQELGLTDLGQVAHFSVPSSFSVNANKKPESRRSSSRRV
ncbi:MAG: YveK family protein [Lactobacillus sp.]